MSRPLKTALKLACWIFSLSAFVPGTVYAAPAGQAVLTAPTAPRVTAAVDDTRRVTLRGNVHPMARSQFETGRVNGTQPMERVILLLQRSAEQDAALKAFHERQYDPTSPDYHHWIHAEEFGRLYGPSDADVAAVTNWLQEQGLQIYEVNKGRTMIQFSGTTAQVEHAFQLEMHHYQIHGEQHLANDREPSIPEALTPVIAGFGSLHDFFAKPQHVLGKNITIDLKTGRKVLSANQVPVTANVGQLALKSSGDAPVGGVTPQFTYTSQNVTHEDLTPYDIAAVYNILPLWQASTPINGTGVKIAISGVSDIKAADVATFRSTFGLPAMAFQTIPNGTDPGTDTKYGGAAENTLDVEMASATAPGAQVLLVVSASTATTGGDLLSDEYIIDNEIAPIMSASYGKCELYLGTAGNASYNAVWLQGATAGISIFESSGDQGSAGCADSDAGGDNADNVGLQVNGIASSPYVTAVGGTDFSWSFVTNGASTYWGASNGTQLQTALGIMPEVPWNATCTSTLVQQADGATSAEQACNGLINSYPDFVAITGGSGGISNCTQPTGTTTSTCAGGYTKPTWQQGYGTSTNRELPDVSLFASAGYPSPLNGSALLFCYSLGGYACVYSPSGTTLIEAQEVGGTSASSPMMAGVMALINQKTNSSQGLANPGFYQLYAKQVTAGTNCNSSTVANGNSCYFYDTTQGTNSQVCITGAPNCVTTTTGDQVGVLSGYNAAVGYDDTTGLGSLNVTNVVNNWPASTAPTVPITLSTTSLTFPSTAKGLKSTAQMVTITNSSASTVLLTSETLTGTNLIDYQISANSCLASLSSGSSCAVSIQFAPTETGTLTASLSVMYAGSGSPQTVALSGTSPAPAPIAGLLPGGLTFPSQTVNTSSTSQSLTLSNTGTAALTNIYVSVTGTNAGDFSQTNNCGTSVAIGSSCTIVVVFAPTASGTRSATITVTDNASPTTQTASLSGTGAAATPGVGLNPTSLTFSSQTVSTQSSAQSITLTNTGAGTLSNIAVAIAGTNAGDFSETNNCGTSLASTSSCTILVSFAPTAGGTRSAAVSISDNATPSPQTVTLSGTGVVASPIAGVSPSSLTFSSETVNTSSASQSITLSNTGTAALANIAISVTGANSGDFSETNNCGTSVAMNSSCTILVSFTPAAVGTRSAAVTIADNASPATQTVALSGTGAAAIVLIPGVGLSPSSLTFSSQVIGAPSAAQIVTLTNTGGAALSISNGISITGSNIGDFSQTNSCGASVGPGGQCQISVTFTPTATGTRTATVSIADNASGSPQGITLTGTGTSTASGPSFSLSTNVSSVTVTRGSSATVTLTVNASGGFNQAVTFLCSGFNPGVACSFNPAIVTVSGASASTTLTISTTAGSNVARLNPTGDGRGSEVVMTVAGLFGLVLLGSARRKRFAALLCGCVLLVGLGALQGCSSGSGGASGGGTPAGTYLIGIQAYSGSGASEITNFTTVSVIVQ